MKKAFLILKWSFGASLLWILVHVLLVVFPQPLFAYQLDHGPFTVRSTEPISSEMRRVLDRTQTLLSASELYDPGLHHTIYLCQSPRLMRHLFLRNMHFGASPRTGDTFITNGDSILDRAYCPVTGPEDRRQRTLSGSIAHEITHRLLRWHEGFWKELRHPRWIVEGYCDLIAQDSPLPIRDAVDMLKNGEQPPGSMMVVYRLMMDHLIHEKGLTIRQIIDRPPDFQAIREAALDPSRLEKWK